MTEQPDWFLQLQRDLSAPVIVPDGAIIDWDQCRDRFLVLLLQRLEKRTTSPHPAIVRQLLERRLAGDDVAAWAAAAWAAAECTAQVADLQAAIAASTQPLAADQLPPDDDGIEEGIDGPERELLQAFYAAINSEGGSTDQVYLRGIRAVLARAAGGFIVPTEVQVASPAPAEEALQRLLQWGGWRSSIGYNADVVLGVVDWANGGMVGPLPPLPEWLRLREAAAPARPTPVDLAALHDSTFSDGLTAAQHRDVLRGGPDLRLPALTDAELLKAYGRARRAYQHEGAIGDDWLREEPRARDLAGLRAVLAQFGGGTQPPSKPTDATRLVEKLGRLVAQLADIDWSDDSLTVAQADDLLQQAATAAAPVRVVNQASALDLNCGFEAASIARPFEEWHEDYGPVLCWRFPIEEPPHVGCPLDSDWDNYYTHWTPLVCPADPTKPAEVQP